MPISPHAVKKVYVVFKTHLDIGFTDTAAAVLQQYQSAFIPRALQVAAAMNGGGEPRFVWTVGSYIIKHVLETAPEELRQPLEEALHKGWIRWHGLACTTHTELMNRRLLEYDLSISRELDRRFHANTIAAKMTDVPGHTIGMVPVLSEMGIAYLHIGVNDASRVPDVPALFRWRLGDAEVIVNYADSYGSPAVLEKSGVALIFAHTHDNLGPQSPGEVEEVFRAAQATYPNAEIVGGTLDDFARHAVAERDSLPLLTDEIGDTWIHGVASDPLKVSRFRRLLRLGEEWARQGLLTPGEAAYDRFMAPMLLVAEHTWGMDTKKYLPDYENWSKADFSAARERDAIPPFDALRTRSGLPGEAAEYMGGEPRYSAFEISHAEQRGYLEQALEALPQDLREQARAQWQWRETRQCESGVPCNVLAPIVIDGWTVEVGPDGRLSHLRNPELGLNCPASLGLFEYDTYDGQVADDCYHQYGRNLSGTFPWSYPDFGKPGLRLAHGVRRESWRGVASRILLHDNRLEIDLQMPVAACEEFGCPRVARIVHRFSRAGIHTTLLWKDKDACRSPEALWFHFGIGVENPHDWRMQKLGSVLSPARVVRGGNRKLHCVEQLLCGCAGGTVRIQPLDSPLASVGAKHLYHVDDSYGNAEDGFYFLLCNNRWGTNFKMWFDEDMRFEYETSFEIP